MNCWQGILTFMGASYVAFKSMGDLSNLRANELITEALEKPKNSPGRTPRHVGIVVGWP